jgi:hypothetical protein
MTTQLAEHQTPASLPQGRGKGPGGQTQGLLPPPGQCPVPGCGDPIDVTRLMCRHDWNLLPRQLQDEVWATWRSGHGAASHEHEQAVLRASEVQRACARPAYVGEPGRRVLSFGPGR